MDPRRTATMVNFLPEDVLLEIFDLFRIMDEATTTINFVPLPGSILLDLFDLFRDEATLDTTTSTHLPWKWHRLAHVCRTWRDIIFASSRRLNLELLCTYGTPVRKNLRHLPPLPIVIHFPDLPKDSDEDNILAALEHPDRVRNVRLCVSCSLSERMVTVMQQPFPVLTHLWLKSTDDGDTLVIPDSFLGGCAPRLQKIDLDGVPFPEPPTLLLSACDLVDIHLHNIPDNSYISPEAMVASLGTSPRLKRLILGSQGEEGPWPYQRLQSPVTRTVLPALTTFFFDGPVGCLEDFVVLTDAPQLNHLAIQYSDDVLDLDLPVPQLCKFINRSEKLKLSQFRHVDLDFRPSSFVIDLNGGRSSLRLSTQYDGILTGLLSQICGMLSNVDRLFISSQNDYIVDDEDIEWLEVFRLFTALKVLGARDQASLCVALELGTLVGEETAGVLPALELLYLENQSVIFVEEFLAARRNVGRPVTLINEGNEFRERLEPDKWSSLVHNLL